MDGQTSDTTKNSGIGWREIGKMEGQETCKKRDDEDDPRRGRSQGRKIGNLRINRGR